MMTTTCRIFLMPNVPAWPAVVGVDGGVGCVVAVRCESRELVKASAPSKNATPTTPTPTTKPTRRRVHEPRAIVVLSVQRAADVSSHRSHRVGDRLANG